MSASARPPDSQPPPPSGPPITGPPERTPPGPQAELGRAGWGPARVALGIVVFLVLVLIEASVVAAIAPPPEYEPVSLAASADGERLFVLDAGADEVLELRHEDDALRLVETTDVLTGADYLAVADLAGDGELDLVVASGEAPPSSSEAGTIELLEGDGEEFSPAMSFRPRDCRSPGGPFRNIRGLAAGEVDGEAPAELIAATGGLVCSYELASGSPRLDSTFRVHALPNALALGDLDADGAPELAVGRRSSEVLVLAGTGDGFARELEIAAPASPQPLAAGDFRSSPGAEIALGSTGESVTLIGADDAGAGVDQEVALDEAPTGLAAIPARTGERDRLLAAFPSDDVAVIDAESGKTLASRSRPQESLSARVALQGLTAITLLAIAFVMAGRGRLASAPELGLRRSRRSPWIPAVLAFATYLACSIAITQLLSPEQRNLAEDLGFGEGIAGNLAAALFIVGIAPIAEELFFRGFVYGGLRRALPVVPALAVAAILFGFAHLGPGDFGVVLQLAVFGTILCGLFEYTGSLWPGIALHLINNTIAFSVLTG